VSLGAGGIAELAALLAAAELRAAARRLARGRSRPGWSWRTELLLAAIKAVLARSKARSVPWLRTAQRLAAPGSRHLRQVRFEAVDCGGVPGQWCAPLALEPRRIVVYMHGGGYVMGDVGSYRATLAHLAVRARARVLGIDYRLAPEHRFPAAHDDCLAALRWLFAGGAAPRSVALAGDSAGAALATATLCALRDAGEPLPAAAVLISPWIDPLADGGSMDANEPFDFGDRELLVGWFEQYAGRGAARDPRLFLLEAKLESLPPLLVQAGGAEIMLDQIHALVARARAAGVDTALEVAEDMFHDFQLQAGRLPEGASAMESIARFLLARVEPEPQPGTR
jgi:acetyl esterase/lipase